MAYIAQEWCQGVWSGEQYIKQSYRSRADLMTANGVSTFSLPIQSHGSPAPPTHRIQLSEHGKWRSRLEQTLRSSYHSTPFWQYYEEELLEIIQDSSEHSLVGLNQKLLIWLCKCWQLPLPVLSSLEEEPLGFHAEIIVPEMFRHHPTPPPYWQIFAERHGFQPHLSALDLLMNIGPEGRLYLLHYPLPSL